MPNHSPRLDLQDIPVERMITWISWVASALLLLFAFKHLVLGPLHGAMGLTVCALLHLLNLALYRISGKNELFRWSYILIALGMFLYLVYSGIDEGAGILWLYAFPPLVFYISTLRIGAGLSFGGLFLVALALSPLDPGLVGHDYDPNFRVMFLLSFAFEVVFCFVLDLGRRRTQTRLISLVHDLDFAARHDGLTELFNRREASRLLQVELDRYRRTHRAFSVLLIDVDHFKRLNDTYGHDAGDEVLRGISRILLESSRRTDVVARWGGEEFLILLPDTASPEALTIADRVCEAVAEARFPVRDQVLGVTLSAGLADIGSFADVDALLRAADDLLYQAKNQGRNRIRVYRPEDRSVAGD